MKAIKINLYSQSNYKTEDAVTVIFEIVNASGFPIKVLKWNTPLEGLRSACLVVKVGSKEIPYDGIKVKRGTPSSESFLEILPGHSLSNRVDVEFGYALPVKGSVSISFDDSRLLISTDKSGIQSKNFYEYALKHRITNVSTKSCRFKLARSKKYNLTFGEQTRSKKKITRKAKIAGAKDPATQGTSDAESRKVKAAHTTGYGMVSTSLAGLSKNDKFEKWFGVHTAGRFATTKGVFKSMKDGFENTKFTYINNGPDCEDGDLAYTTDGNDKIWLCSAFWILSGTGVDSQAGTIVHEHSHASAFTDDHEYGQEKCLKLAKNDPSKAIDNADNYEYYTET